jgi:hypothetical protein
MDDSQPLDPPKAFVAVACFARRCLNDVLNLVDCHMCRNTRLPSVIRSLHIGPLFAGVIGNLRRRPIFPRIAYTHCVGRLKPNEMCCRSY